MTTTTHKATKTAFRRDNFGMARATWDYRGVRLNYSQTTKRRSPWHAKADNHSGWWHILASNKAELMAKVDDYLDSNRYVARSGRLCEVTNAE